MQLTISRPVQRAAEAVAAETMTSGCILVLDVDTAQVRASVSLPGYDPDNIAASLDEAGSPLLDRTLAAYAVGSVFKPVLAAAALEAGLDGLTVECPGYTVVDGQVFRCASGTAHGTVDLAAALEKSCNGYFIRLGQELGAETVLEAARRLGFGSGVRVAGTLQGAAGVLPEAESLTPAGQLANFSFGQGQLLATPLQVAAMINAIAADGVYRAPSFVLHTLDEATGAVLESYPPPAARQAFSASTARRLQQLLAGVVAEGTRPGGPPPSLWTPPARPAPLRPASSHPAGRKNEPLVRRLLPCLRPGIHGGGPAGRPDRAGAFQRGHLCPGVPGAVASAAVKSRKNPARVVCQ